MLTGCLFKWRAASVWLLCLMVQAGLFDGFVFTCLARIFEGKGGDGRAHGLEHRHSAQHDGGDDFSDCTGNSVLDVCASPIARPAIGINSSPLEIPRGVRY